MKEHNLDEKRIVKSSAEKKPWQTPKMMEVGYQGTRSGYGGDWDGAGSS